MAGHQCCRKVANDLEVETRQVKPGGKPCDGGFAGRARRPAEPRHCWQEPYRLGGTPRPAKPGFQPSHSCTETSVAASPPTPSDSIQFDPTRSDSIRPISTRFRTSCDRLEAKPRFCIHEFVSKSCSWKQFCRTKGRCRTNPNDGRIQSRKTSFLHRNTNFSISSRPP